MDIQEILNSINSSMAPKEIKETTKLTDLPQNLPYIIKDLKTINTKYGESLLAELQLKYSDKLVDYSVFLPQRFAKMPKPQIDILIKMPEVRFVYKGKNASGIHDISFDVAK